MTNQFNIVIVEDDKWYSEILKYHLELNPDNSIQCFEDGETFLNKVKQAPDLVCIDYSMPGLNGEELLKRIKVKFPSTEVIVISGQDDVGTAINLINLGAYDYLIKDDETKNKLWNTILRIKENKELKEEVRELKKEVLSKYNGNSAFIGESPQMIKVFKLIEKAGQVDITVSITGETGTGKEVVAKSIHYNSIKKAKPFVAVNIAAIPNELAESELFGHEKGAFTGASARRIGKFEEAQGGTLFLDEIGEMDINMQAKLLRALQEKEIIRVGGSKKVKLDIRIIVATHRNLLEEVQKGTFRQDLYYRLLGLPIELPPLRQRGSDILLLSTYFLNEFCSSNNKSKQLLSKGAKNKLLAYPFPGNVRELKALIELSSVMSEGNTIKEEDISYRVSGGSLSDLMRTELSLKEYTAKIVQHYLDKYDKNVIKTAKALQVGKSTIYRMIQSNEVKL
jgi:two-component system response regulator AtoC